MKIGLRKILQTWLFPKPTSSYRGIDVNRCVTDGQLVTKKTNLETHGGHRVMSPIVLTFKEKLMIRFGIIE